MQEQHLSKRERQIMDVVYALGGATATQVLRQMEDPPSRSAVRTFLKILEQKGYLRHKQVGQEYLFQPIQPRRNVGKSALKRVLDVFFSGSLESAVAAHLLDPKSDVSDEELQRLSSLISQARKKGR